MSSVLFCKIAYRHGDSYTLSFAVCSLARKYPLTLFDTVDEKVATHLFPLLK
jgi:hypothetical protein